MRPSTGAGEKILTQHILTTKIQIPPLPPHIVRRTRLLDELDRGLQPNIRVTLISAPAGYGKTTLLSDWLQSRDLSAAWFSISEGDNDAARFVSYLMAAADTADESLDIPKALESQVSVEDLKQRLLVPLINQIGRREQMTLFVFDDYHLIQSQAVLDLTGYLIENLPPQAHVFIATRADPLLPIMRLRGRGQVNELRLEDLRFQEDEAEAFFGAVSGLQLAAEDVQALHQKTEGWICGLQMTATFLRGQTDTKAFIAGFSGTHHYIVDYLLDEVLRRESREVQTFLLETSILERLSGPLCDAVCERVAPLPDAPRPARRQDQGQYSSRQLLRELEQANLFILPLDEQREWYRYHRLFADLLQVRLQEKDAGRMPILHRRASEWFAEHGYGDEAVRHALLSSDAEFASGMIEGYAQDILLRSETATFLRWVQRLPEEQIVQRPKLGIYRAWALLMQGAPVSAVQAQIAESRQGEGPPGSSRSLEAFILLCQGQIEQGLQRAQEALEILPAEEIFLRDFAVTCLASGRISLGDVDSGLQLLGQAAQSPNRPDNKLATALVLCELAELRLKQFRFDEAQELYQRALTISTTAEGTPLPIAGHAMMGLGDIALERFDLDAAEGLLKDGIKLTERWSLINTLEGYLSLAMLYHAQEQTGAVRESPLRDTLATLEDLARRFDASEYDDIVVETVKMRASLDEGNLGAVRQWVFERGFEQMPAQKPAHYADGTIDSRIYKYELPILARWHIAEGRFQDAVAVLRELAHLAAEAERPYLLVESLILQARVFQLMGKAEAALNALARALAIAEPQGARRLFLAEGEDMMRLLSAGEQEWKTSGSAEFVDDLRTLWKGISTSAPDGEKEEPLASAAQPAGLLSPRELEVLHLLPSSLTAVEMADELFISANTLRSHLKNIYAKLGVHSRHEAVVKATQLELL